MSAVEKRQNDPVASVTMSLVARILCGAGFTFGIGVAKRRSRTKGCRRDGGPFPAPFGGSAARGTPVVGDAPTRRSRETGRERDGERERSSLPWTATASFSPTLYMSLLADLELYGEG